MIFHKTCVKSTFAPTVSYVRVYLHQQKVFGLTITTVNSVQTKFDIISRNFWAFQNIHTVEVKPYWENVYFELNDS